MYLHLGQDTVITTKSIIGIFDMDRCTVSKKREIILQRQRKRKCCECFLRTAEVIYCLQGKRKNHGLYKPAFE